MAKLTAFWVVRDPSPDSELVDILFESSPDDFCAYCNGTGLAQFKRERHTIYTSEAEARRDAAVRLASRKPV